jgi:hypothetical protein
MPLFAGRVVDPNGQYSLVNGGKIFKWMLQKLADLF